MQLTPEGLLEFLDIDLGIDIIAIDQNTLLFSSGIIDSFALVSLLTYIETEAGIRIAPGDVNLANFDSIGRIFGYVTKAIA